MVPESGKGSPRAPPAITTRTRNRFEPSLRVKTLAFSAALAMFSVVLSGAVVYGMMASQLVTREKEKIAALAQEASLELAVIVENARHDALITVGAPAVQGLIRAMERGDTDRESEAPRGIWKDRTVALLKALVEPHSVYREARLFQIGTEPREILRLAREGHTVVSVPGDQLSASSDRPDIRELLRPGVPSPFVSDLVLDHGHGESALVPVTHISVRLYDSTNQLFGLFVLTVDLGSFLADLRQRTPVTNHIYVLNSQGQLIVNSDAAPADRAVRIEDRYPTFPAAFGSGQLQRDHRVLKDKDGTYQVLGGHDTLIGDDATNHRIRFLFGASHADVRAQALAGYHRVGIGGVLVVLVTLPLALIFGTSLVRPIHRMTAFIESWTPGTAFTGLPTERPDDIGVLARAFAQLLESLESREKTLQKIAASLEHSEALSRNMIESMLDGHFVSDSHGSIRSWNRAAETIFGYSASEILGKDISLLILESPSGKHADYIGCYGQGGCAGMMGSRKEFPGRRRNGAIFPMEITVTGFRAGDVEWHGTIIRDLTEQKAREGQLLHMISALETAADNISILDQNGFIVFVNRSWEKTYDQRLADVIGKRPSNSATMDLKGKALQDMIASTQRGDSWSGVLQRKALDGRLRTDEVTISPIRDPAGHVTSYVVIGRDITEKVGLETQLRQAQKLESIGQLAAGIAHEINTPTQYVGDNIRFVQEAFTELNVLLGKLTALSGSTAGAEPLGQALAQALGSVDLGFLRDEVPKALEQSADGCQRISGIVKAMKDFSHPGQDKTPVDLNRAISSTITVAANEWKYVADVRTDFDAQLPHVVCLPGEFNQVILNMLVNAAHAIADVVANGDGGKGTITVTTRQQGEWAEIRISDTGTGVPPEVREKIFDPFFTTKEVGKGTGQGLAIAHNVIVNKHGGSIVLESELGKGSTFIIRLPLASDSGAAARAA